MNESALKRRLSLLLVKNCHRVAEARSISKMSINPPQADALCLGASVALMRLRRIDVDGIILTTRTLLGVNPIFVAFVTFVVKD